MGFFAQKWAFFVALAASACAAADVEPLRAVRLRPTAGHAVRGDRPCRFTFEAKAGNRRGVTMQRFQLKILQAGKLIAARDVQSALPVAELNLLPGRYSWSVQWWSSDGEASEVGNSELIVASPQADSEWDGVPWLGAADKNEFKAEVNVGALSGQVELKVSTLGFGYVTINGRELSADLLSYAGWTNTEKRVLFRTYDVTSFLDNDGLSLFVGLGCGYRCDPKNRFPAYKDQVDRSHDAVPKIFRLQVLVDGKLIFHSGSAGWLARQGPVVEDSVYDGEVFVQSRSTLPWSAAVPLPAGAGPRGAMVAATFPGVQVTRRDSPVSITQPSAGVHVVDFGSNVAGVCSISVPKASIVSLKYGEIMQHAKLPTLKSPDPKRVYFGNLRSAAQNDTLVLTEPIRDWWPRFTYHGFRYVEVYGYPGDLNAADITRLVMNTALESKANASFGDEVLDAIHLGSKGVQRSNLMQVPTDCPQRDERLGWMGDASLSAESFLLHFDYGSMAEAFVDSMADELGSDGSLPDVVPFQRFGGRPADLSWSSAFLENMYALWKVSGNLNVSGRLWPQVRSHLGNLQAQMQRAGSLTKLAQPYGDWCPPPRTPGRDDKESASKGFSSAAALIRTVGQIAELGSALGGTAALDAAAAKALHARLLTDFHNAYYHADKQEYDNGVMLTFVLPLAIGAVPEAEVQGVVKNLLRLIAERNGTWSGGIINNRFLFDVLHDHGAADTALAMLRRKDYPSYGYMYFNDLEPAKECMWELPDAPYQGDGMNSRAHHMFSSVGHYLITRVAGLSVQRTQVLAAVGLLETAEANILTDFGLVSFAWTRGVKPSAERALPPQQQRMSGPLSVRLTVPVGLRAALLVPSEDGQLRGADGNLQEQRGVEGVEERVLHNGQYFTRLTLGAGTFDFAFGLDASAASLLTV